VKLKFPTSSLNKRVNMTALCYYSSCGHQPLLAASYNSLC